MILVLIILAIVFSIVGVVSDIGIKQVTGTAAKELNELPFTFGFIVIILLILILFLLILEITPLRKLS